VGGMNQKKEINQVMRRRTAYGGIKSCPVSIEDKEISK
jgi:hypothetical protein